MFVFSSSGHNQRDDFTARGSVTDKPCGKKLRPLAWIDWMFVLVTRSVPGSVTQFVLNPVSNEFV
jgi:hypothetical protein